MQRQDGILSNTHRIIITHKKSACFSTCATICLPNRQARSLWWVCVQKCVLNPTTTIRSNSACLRQSPLDCRWLDGCSLGLCCALENFAREVPMCTRLMFTHVGVHSEQDPASTRSPNSSKPLARRMRLYNIETRDMKSRKARVVCAHLNDTI